MFPICCAAPADCPGIAQIQVDSYRTAYAGLMPPAYLEHFTDEEQAQGWREWLAERAEDILLVTVDR
jgi:hypothetical protein